ncbi:MULTISPECIES: hypothetical protein [unclassified Lentimonas]|uniref:hypothetical protein n=2 Tax=Lentimonas TaxID=417293 RepID=UPI001321DE7D|nr:MULTISPECIES: hypothetical protein [unclassified Lentimonas]CAA7170227.1 Unannotated [Lentimonas sp. CC21]CAA6679521.1 Unannotated [Lentimonas sp. CC4]CAA6687192.1 Unannotated [Lentimonas sp. CC6]CAA7075461.1 Unannotated [Lentimonas sp. CC4]CAA7182522.1 Unannotated [Lentimonas sp. CC8]
MNQIMEKLKQYPIAIFGAVVLLVCAVVIFLRGSVVDELTAKEDELFGRLRTISSNAKNSKDLEQHVELIDRYVASIDERLFSRAQRSINTDYFYSFEDDLDILISDVSQTSAVAPSLIKGGPNALKLYSAISYDVRVDGRFQDILEFLYEIHKADALMRVTDFDVSAAMGAADSVVDLTAKLRIVVLAEKE